MDLWEAVVVAFRRWYVLVPAFVIGVYLALQLAESVAPVHEASATMQYIPANTDVLVDPDEVEIDPEDADNPAARRDAEAAERDAARAEALANPYSDLRSLAIAVELTATSESFARGLAESGLDAEFEIATDPRQPVLYITTLSTSPEIALDTLDALIEFAEEESTERQIAAFNEDVRYHVTPDILRQDETTTIDLTSRTRARLLLLVVAAVGSVGAAVLVDVLFASLKRRREGGDDGPVEPAVVWFGVPVQGGVPPVAPQYPQQPYLAPAPEEPPRMTGTDGDGDGDGPPSRGSRWSR